MQVSLTCKVNGDYRHSIVKPPCPEPSSSSFFHHLDANKPGLQTLLQEELTTAQELLFLIVGQPEMGFNGVDS